MYKYVFLDQPGKSFFVKEFQGFAPVIFHTFINKLCGWFSSEIKKFAGAVNIWYNFANNNLNNILSNVQYIAGSSVAHHHYPSLGSDHKENQQAERENNKAIGSAASWTRRWLQAIIPTILLLVALCRIPHCFQKFYS